MFISYSKHIVKVEVDSRLDVIPDIIEGSPGQRDVTVGKYRTAGESVRSSYIQGSSAPVRPIKPYIETSQTFGMKINLSLTRHLRLSKTGCKINATEQVLL